MAQRAKPDPAADHIHGFPKMKSQAPVAVSRPQRQPAGREDSRVLDQPYNNPATVARPGYRPQFRGGPEGGREDSVRSRYSRWEPSQR